MPEDPNIVPDQSAELPTSETQSEQVISPTPAYSEQYPPLPSMYAQVPDPYGAPAINYGAGQPMYPLPPVMPPPGYGMPPAGYGMPFMPPPGYAQSPFAERPGSHFAPLAQPLPLAQAVRELPHQYRKILTKPGARSFAEEQGKAEWGIIWVQLLFMALLVIVSTLVNFSVEIRAFATFFTSMATLTANSGNPGTLTPTTLTSPSTIFVVIEGLIAGIITPLLFLAGVGIQFGMAKLFRGHGQYTQQAYNHLLFYIPVQVITLALSLLPLLFSTLSTNPLILIFLLIVSFASVGLGIYSVVLNVFAIMATHRMSGGKATGVVLIPYGAAIVLYVLLIFVLIFYILSTVPH